MNCIFDCSGLPKDHPSLKAFVLYREHVAPVLEAKRASLEAMYAPVMGRPEIDPVFLMGLTLLQMMDRLPDRQAVCACLFDARWRYGLNIPFSWLGMDPTTRVYFRQRILKHNLAQMALNAALEAMRAAGYLKTRRSVRIDSIHLLGQMAILSRLECVRETLRLALEFLGGENGSAGWEPWYSRYAERDPKELRKPSAQRLKDTLHQAGCDCALILKRADASVRDTEPMKLLRKVFEEQFESADTVKSKEKVLSDAVQNPHDPEARWSTQKAMGKKGWTGYKVQVCETVIPGERPKGEPTEAVITAVVVQPATTSDHGSIETVPQRHKDHGQQSPATVYADAGYISASQMVRAETDGLEIVGPMPAPPHSASRFGSDAFQVDLPSRSAVCPGGKTSSACARSDERSRSQPHFYFRWSTADCENCPLRAQCLSKKKREPFRTLQVGEDHRVAQARRQLCRTPDYRERMKRRSGIEGTISELTRGYGLRRTRYRGRAKTNLQSQFTAAACNLRRGGRRICWVNRQKAI